MNIHPGILMAGVSLGAGLLLAGLLYVVFVVDFSVSDETQIEIRLSQYQSAAEIYGNRLTDFVGLCRDLGITPDVTCVANADAFRVSATADNGALLCGDHTGFLGRVPHIPSGATDCQAR